MTDTTEYVSVPKVATDEMIAAGWIDKEDVNPDDIYRAMLAAAPPPPSPWKDIESAPKDGYLVAFIRGGTFAIPHSAGSERGWVSFSGAVEALRAPDGSWRDTRLMPCVYRPTHYMLVEDLLALPTDGGKE